jgi:rod shape determining protein RodA
MKRVFSAVWKYLNKADIILISITLIASFYGFILVYSATQGSGRTVAVQIVSLAIGIVGMVILSKLDYHSMTASWKYIAIAGAVLLILPLAIGSSRAGSLDKSWIWIGKFTIQPSEFVKLAFVLTFSKHYDMVREKIRSPRTVLLLFLHGMAPIAILILQKDMGMMLVYLLMLTFMMFAAGVQLRYFAIICVGLVAGAPLIWSKILGATQRLRILALFNPIKYASDAYQQVQGRLAIGSGGLYGYGLFKGPETQGPASLLPEKQNDMIFSVAGEELGFIGCMLILVIFTLLLLRLIQIARNSKDSLGSMIVIGIFASFAVQMMINVGMVLMVLPVIGISLPFFSSGGSSVTSCFFAVGIALSVHMQQNGALFSGRTKA